MEIKSSITTGRNSLNLTQTELAKILGVTKQSVHCWEKGMSMPKYTYLIRLAKLYGVTIDDLLRINDKKPA